jgi:hypothetical protein
MGETAVKISEAVLVPIVGKKAMEYYRSYVAKLTADDVWIVHGTQPNPNRAVIGGNFTVRLSKQVIRWK